MNPPALSVKNCTNPKRSTRFPLSSCEKFTLNASPWMSLRGSRWWKMKNFHHLNPVPGTSDRNCRFFFCSHVFIRCKQASHLKYSFVAIHKYNLSHTFLISTQIFKDCKACGEIYVICLNVAGFQAYRVLYPRFQSCSATCRVSILRVGRSAAKM